MSRGLDLIGFLGRRTRASIRSDGTVLLTAIDRTYLGPYPRIYLRSILRSSPMRDPGCKTGVCTHRVPSRIHKLSEWSAGKTEGGRIGKSAVNSVPGSCRFGGCIATQAALPSIPGYSFKTRIAFSGFRRRSDVVSSTLRPNKWISSKRQHSLARLYSVGTRRTLNLLLTK